jgi:hypothetical protein
MIVSIEIKTQMVIIVEASIDTSVRPSSAHTSSFEMLELFSSFIRALFVFHSFLGHRYGFLSSTFWCSYNLGDPPMFL